jgi:hypothetical protein
LEGINGTGEGRAVVLLVGLSTSLILLEEGFVERIPSLARYSVNPPRTKEARSRGIITAVGTNLFLRLGRGKPKISKPAFCFLILKPL